MPSNNLNSAQMQLWQISTFSNYPLNVQRSHVHVCRGCPSSPMAQQKNMSRLELNFKLDLWHNMCPNMKPHVHPMQSQCKNISMST